MVSANRWLAALAAAGIPAFRCRYTSAGLEITCRTPAFMAVMQRLTDLLDEKALLDRLAAQWSARADGESFTIGAADAPTWQCVLCPVDTAGDHLAILQLPAQWQGPDDTFLTMVENLPDVVTRFDRQYRCQYANPPMAALTGVARETRHGKTHAEAGTSQELGLAFQAAYQRVFDSGEPVELEFSYSGTTGLRHYLGRATPEFDRQGRVQTVLSVVRDISEVKQLQHELELLSKTDPLTGLLNRRSFTSILDAELQRVQRGQGALSVLLLDLNNFKYLNDRFGHVVGDRVLKTVGQILTEETRPEDACARLGGDEFCVALVDTDADGAGQLAALISRRVCAIEDGGRLLGVGVSVGVSQADRQDTAADLLARVDRLMYQIKSEGADRRSR